jgi:hypothetical protein
MYVLNYHKIVNVCTTVHGPDLTRSNLTGPFCKSNINRKAFPPPHSANENPKT